MDEREYSRPLTVHRVSDYPEIKKVLNDLFVELSKLLGRISVDKTRKFLNLVVLDLFVAYKTDPDLYVGYSRAKDKYRPGTLNHSFFLRYRPLMRVIDGLDELGYLENHRGFYDRKSKIGRQSRMRATPKLIDLIEGNAATSEMVDRELGQPIILRDKDKQELVFEPTEETNRYAEQVQRYNEVLSRNTLKLCITDAQLKKEHGIAVDYSNFPIHRIFNETFSRGGRFYGGWWQNIPRELRRYITINGKSTSELDYSGQHLLMLYGIKGEEYQWLYDNDPYQLPGFGKEIREILKAVALRAINAADREEALKAITYELRMKFWDNPYRDVDSELLIDAFMAKHPLIKEDFFSGAGLELQFIDSQIAEYVLNHMMVKHQIVLPVHDSFVVQNEHLPRLFRIMKEAYRMQGVDSIPGIKLKPGINNESNKLAFLQLAKLIETERAITEGEKQAISEIAELV